MASRRYDDPCGIARALDIVGERWALLVVRELIFGPKRYVDLQRGLAGISQNVLAQRLRELEDGGVLRRRRLGPPASVSVYELTDQGAQLEPVLLTLGRWGTKIPLSQTPNGKELSVDALVFALRTTFDPARADDLSGRFVIGLDDDEFVAEITDGRFVVVRDRAGDADAVITTDPATFRALVFGDRPLSESIMSGAVSVEGDVRTVERLLRCFPRVYQPDR